MLAMADEDGYVGASVGGLARRAGVTREQAEEALASFLGPDPDSRDGTTGERIQVAERGWQLVNHRKFRDMRTRNQRLKAERQARWRAKRSDEASPVDAVDVSKTTKAEAEVEAEVEKKKKKGANRAPSREQAVADCPEGVSPETWQRWVEHQWARKKPTPGALAQHRKKLSALSDAQGVAAAEDFVDQCIGANAQGIPRWAYEQAMAAQANLDQGRSHNRVDRETQDLLSQYTFVEDNDGDPGQDRASIRLA